MKEKNKNLLIRTLTSIVFVAVLISSILLGYGGFSILFLFITAMSASELSRMLGWKSNSAVHALVFISASAIFILNALVAWQMLPAKFLSLIIPIIFLPFLIQLWNKNPDPFNQVGLKVLSILYTSIAPSLLCYIVASNGKYRPEVLLGILFILWANDSGAYLTGFFLGKTKLFERISPKKTWEGAIGGLLFACLTAWLIAKAFWSLTDIQWIVVAVIITIIGSLGDLVESQLKRSLNIKDSGNLLPGHGGMLDRFDSLFFAIPFIWVFLTLIR